MITSFHGEYAFLSNMCPAVVIYEGKTYPTVEHAYVSAKTLDLAQRDYIANIVDPHKAKTYGSPKKKNIEVRIGWDLLKVSIMTDLVRQKFFNNTKLGDLLLATGDQLLIEGNNWNDTFWGICRGVGYNHLGKILMQIREELRCKRNIK